MTATEPQPTAHSRPSLLRGTLMLSAILGLLIGLLLLLGLSTRDDADPFAAEAVTDPPFTPLTYGIQAFLWWDGGEVGFHLDWTRMMGFSHVKQTFAWHDLEPRPGEWDFSQADRILRETDARGLRVVARLGGVPAWAHDLGADHDHTDVPPSALDGWAGYCGTLADRYAGRIHAYQVWNEPNLSREWGGAEPDAAAYVELLAACHDAIKAADPAAIVISAGLAPTGDHNARAHRDDLYLQAMYDAGFQRYADVVGVHAPGFDAPQVGPDDAEAMGRQRWMSFRRVEDLRQIMVSNGDAAHQMAILEVGWTTDEQNPEYAWFAVTQDEQAQYLREAYAYAAAHWRPWVGLMSAIYLAKPTWTPDDEEWWWAITEPRLDEGYIALRPALDALLRMPKLCGDVTVPALAPDEVIPLEPRNPCH